jgi:hypothetical protein
MKKVQILLLLLAINLYNCEGQFNHDEDCEDGHDMGGGNRVNNMRGGRNGNFRRVNGNGRGSGMNGRSNVKINVSHL